MKKPKQLDPFASEPEAILEPDIFSLPRSLGQKPTETPFELGKAVANKHPTISGFDYRIAIIGEAPGKDEEIVGEPFVGASGKFLAALLSKAKVAKSACFIGNVCQYRPPKNDIKFFSREGKEIAEGLDQLDKDLAEFNPNICLLLGKTALWAAKGIDRIGDWRGSFFISNIQGPFFGRKCISSFHPAFCLRSYDSTPLLMFDILKCAKDATSKELVLPQRDLRIDLTVDLILDELDKVKRDKPLIALDIEGGVNTMSCMSIAPSPDYSFIIPFTNMDGSNYYENIDDEYRVWDKLVDVLADPSIYKVLQNGLYDRFVLQYSYGLIIHGVVDDTMLKHWELYCELEKSLGVQASIYTREPYYKSERKNPDRDVFWRYCCKDSALTYEINDKLRNYLTSLSRQHYELNVAMSNLTLYMELKGIKYDYKLAKQRREEILQHVYTVQSQLDSYAGCGIDSKQSKLELELLVRSVLCFKRNPQQPKKGNDEDLERCLSVLRLNGDLTPNGIGLINTACDLTLNIKSKRFKTYLYETKGFPKQWKKDLKTKEMKLTTDFEALLRLKKLTKDPCIDYAIQLTMHRTRAQMLSILPAKDGRMRCSYNQVGSETGRISSSRSMVYVGNKRVGTNMQTVSDDWEIEDEELVLLTEGLRNLYVADNDCYIAQCDLKGSDGWTVGSELAGLGDRTMYEDLLFGLKPAQVVCYILRHGNREISRAPRNEIKEMVKEVAKESWDYYCSKQIIWGTCYLLGPKKASELVYKESYGKIELTEAQAREFQNAVHARYNVKLWHHNMTNYIRSFEGRTPTLTSFSGHTRKFFGRKEDILGEMLSHKPQSITTYATNYAAYRLWTDPSNRLADGKLIVEPIHQVHDALLVQFKQSDLEYAKTKLAEWFNNKIQNGGQTFVIPYEGNYGTNWSMDSEAKVGSI